MGSSHKVQGKAWVSEDTWDTFHKIVARKWGIHKHGLLSYELEQALKYYNSVDGLLPEIAHTHKNSAENTIAISHAKKKVNNNKDKVELLTTVGGRAEQREQGQRQGDIILTNWLMTKGVDLMDINRFNQSVTDADLENAHKLNSDLEYRNQWRKDCIAKLEAKDKRISNNNTNAELAEQDRTEILPIMKKMKSYLFDKYAEEVIPYDRVSRILLFEANNVATGHVDQRTFDKDIALYRLHEYLYAVDGKKAFRLTDKFKEL